MGHAGRARCAPEVAHIPPPPRPPPAFQTSLIPNAFSRRNITFRPSLAIIPSFFSRFRNVAMRIFLVPPYFRVEVNIWEKIFKISEKGRAEWILLNKIQIEERVVVPVLFSSKIKVRSYFTFNLWKILSILLYLLYSIRSKILSNVPFEFYKSPQTSIRQLDPILLLKMKEKRKRKKMKRKKTVAVTMLERDAAHNVTARNRE